MIKQHYFYSNRVHTRKMQHEIRQVEPFFLNLMIVRASVAA